MMKEETAAERRRKATVSFRLPVELKIRVEALAEKTGRSSSSIYSQLVSEHIDEIEKAYECVAILDEIKAGTFKTIPVEDVCRDLGIDWDSL